MASFLKKFSQKISAPPQSQDSGGANKDDDGDGSGGPATHSALEVTLAERWWPQFTRSNVPSALAPKHHNIAKIGWQDRNTPLAFSRIMFQPGEDVVFKNFAPLFCKSIELERSREGRSPWAHAKSYVGKDPILKEPNGDEGLSLDEPLSEMPGRQVVFTNQRILLVDSSYVEVLRSPDIAPQRTSDKVSFLKDQVHSAVLPPDVRRTKMATSLVEDSKKSSVGWKNLFTQRKMNSTKAGGPSACLPLPMGANPEGSQTTIEYTYFRAIPLSGVIEARLDFVSAARTSAKSTIDVRDVRGWKTVCWDAWTNSTPIVDPRLIDGCCCKPDSFCERNRHKCIRVILPALLWICSISVAIVFYAKGGDDSPPSPAPADRRLLDDWDDWDDNQAWGRRRLNAPAPSPVANTTWQRGDAKDAYGFGVFFTLMLWLFLAARPFWQFVRRHHCCQRVVTNINTLLEIKRQVLIRTVDNGTLILDISSAHNTKEIVDAVNGLVHASRAFATNGQETLSRLKLAKKRLHQVDKAANDLADRAEATMFEIKESVEAGMFDHSTFGGSEKDRKKYIGLLKRRFDTKEFRNRFKKRKEKRKGTKSWLEFQMGAYKNYGGALASQNKHRRHDTMDDDDDAGGASKDDDEGDESDDEGDDEGSKGNAVTRVCGILARAICCVFWLLTASRLNPLTWCCNCRRLFCCFNPCFYRMYPHLRKRGSNKKKGKTKDDEGESSKDENQKNA